MTRETRHLGENHVMRTLLATLLAGGVVAAACIAAPAHRGAGAPTADPEPCPSAWVQLPRTVGAVDGLIASTGVPTYVGYGTCVAGIVVSVPVLGHDVPVPTPGITPSITL